MIPQAPINYRRLSNDITEVVASAFNYLDFIEAFGKQTATTTATTIQAAIDNWPSRYRHDQAFRCKTDMIVSKLMFVVQREEELSFREHEEHELQSMEKVA